MEYSKESDELLNAILAAPDEELEKEEEQLMKLFDSLLTEESIEQQLANLQRTGRTIEEVIAETEILETVDRDTINTTEGLSEIKKRILNQILDITIQLNHAIITRGTRVCVNIPVSKCKRFAVIPTYARNGDAGADLYSAENLTINPGETKIIHIGLKVAIPTGYEWQIRPRSGFTLNEVSNKMLIPNSPGTIDAGYRDEVGVIMRNTGTLPFAVTIGDRIAQAVLMPVPKAMFYEAEDIDSIGENRGGGFGSTGV